MLNGSPLIAILVIGIGLVAPKVAVALYLAIALFVIIPFRAVIRLIRRRSGP